MKLIIKIAWRNIQRHKGKSFVIGIILFMGAFILTLGSAVTAGMDKGLEKNIVNGFMGNVVIASVDEKDDEILMKGPMSSSKAITNYAEINKHLRKFDFIDKYLPIGKGTAQVLNDEEGDSGMAFIIGADLEEYRKMFPENFKIIDGESVDKNTKGIFIPEKLRGTLYNSTNLWFVSQKDGLVKENINIEYKPNNIITKNSIILQGFSEKDSTLDIKADVKGIIKYSSLNSFWGQFALIDIDSYRESMGYLQSQEKDVVIPEEKKSLFESDNLDNMFDENSLEVTKPQSNAVKEEIAKPVTKDEVKEMKNNGTYNLVFVKVKDEKNIEKSIVEMNKVFTENNLGVKAVYWKTASGPIGQFATIIKASLYGFVVFVFFVAIIIIINTLSMAALERTSEIGMMRAVGAQKGFIEKMFFGETAFLSIFFGGLGICVGIATVWILNIANITSTQELVQLLFGGERFTPVIDIWGIISAILQLAAVTIIAMIYPARVASRIVPLDAISRD